MFGLLLNTSVGAEWIQSPSLLIGAIFAVVLIASHPELTRPDVRRRLAIVLALLAVVVLPVTMLAVDLFAECNWEWILDYCGGNEFCAWYYWLWASCPVR